jgi:hypothetical protein
MNKEVMTDKGVDINREAMTSTVQEVIETMIVKGEKDIKTATINMINISNKSTNKNRK